MASLWLGQRQCCCVGLGPWLQTPNRWGSRGWLEEIEMEGEIMERLGSLTVDSQHNIEKEREVKGQGGNGAGTCAFLRWVLLKPERGGQRRDRRGFEIIL